MQKEVTLKLRGEKLDALEKKALYAGQSLEDYITQRVAGAARESQPFDYSAVFSAVLLIAFSVYWYRAETGLTMANSIGSIVDIGRSVQTNFDSITRDLERARGN